MPRPDPIFSAPENRPVTDRTTLAVSSEVVRLWPTDPAMLRGQPLDKLPELTLYRPPADRDTGASMLVLPGGGYRVLAGHEGGGFALWLAGQGITAASLRYRLGSEGYRHPSALTDAVRGLQYLRHLARTEGRYCDRVGVMGSSAGGHLAATLLTRRQFNDEDPPAGDFQRESWLPDLGVLCYPVITMGEHAHGGSKYFLLGESPDAALIEELSAERQVTPTTPPCFIWHTWEDASVPVENTLLFAAALRRAGVRFDLHIFEKGPHGLGLGTPDAPAPPWAALLLTWLALRGYVNSSGATAPK